MPKYLVLNGDPTRTWRLPADSDLDAVRREIRSAMESAGVVEVAVEMNDNPLVTAPMLINRGTLSAAHVVELPGL